MVVFKNCSINDIALKHKNIYVKEFYIKKICKVFISNTAREVLTGTRGRVGREEMCTE